MSASRGMVEKDGVGVGDKVEEVIPTLTINGSSFGQDSDSPHCHVLQVQDG